MPFLDKYLIQFLLSINRIPNKNNPPPTGLILKSMVEVMNEAFPVNRIARNTIKYLKEVLSLTLLFLLIPFSFNKVQLFSDFFEMLFATFIYIKIFTIGFKTHKVLFFVSL